MTFLAQAITRKSLHCSFLALWTQLLLYSELLAVKCKRDALLDLVLSLYGGPISPTFLLLLLQWTSMAYKVECMMMVKMMTMFIPTEFAEKIPVWPTECSDFLPFIVL
jgi:hypothetical protein